MVLGGNIGRRSHDGSDYYTNGLNDESNPCGRCGFYKIMVFPSLQFKTLRLPETFTDAFGDEISKVCSLTVPSGESHQVALVKKENELWFDDGWERFVDRYSIAYGYFLIFIYNGHSNFEVKILNLTACEISYLCDEGTSSPVQTESFPGVLRRGYTEEPDSDDHENVVLENLHSAFVNNKQHDVNVVELDCEDDEIKSETLGKTSADLMVESEDSHVGSELPTWLMNNEEEMKDMLAAVGIAIPTNPFFVALMKPYVLSKGGFLYIPRSFVKDHMKGKRKRTAEIVMPNGIRWPVRLTANCSLGKGWIRFSREACLRVGDVCYFEVIDAQNCVLKVHIVKSASIKAALALA